MSNVVYKFKITLNQELILLTPMMLTWIFVLLIFKFILRLSLVEISAVIIFIVIFIIDTLPTIILNTQYLIRNQGTTLILNTETKELVYETRKKKVKYSFADIKGLDYYRCFGNGSGWYSYAQHRYYKITFADNTKIFITCLMINNIENTLENLLQIKAEKHFKLLSLLR